MVPKKVEVLLEYPNDQSAYYTPRTLVDKAYVDSQISGNTATYECGEAINSHTPIALVNGGLAVKYDATNINHLYAFIGFSTTSGIMGGPIVVQLSGVITLSGWGLTPGASYLASPAGTILTVDNINNVFKKIIGQGISVNDLLILHNLGIKK